jgi:hypothetical protein
MIALQLILFCTLFTLMVKLAVGNNALNALYFYPKPVQERVYELGLTDRKTVAKKRKRFMIPFFLVMLAVLLLIIGLWNSVRDFWPAYGQALLFLEVMNWPRVIPRCPILCYPVVLCCHVEQIRHTQSHVIPPG